MNTVFEDKVEMIYKGKWVEKADDSYLEDCYENTVLTIHKKYVVGIFTVVTHGTKNAVVVSDDGISVPVDLNLFWTLDQWRDIKLKSLGI